MRLPACIVFCFLFSLLSNAQKPSDLVRINQTGYYPGGKKHAVVIVTEMKETTFQLIETGSGKTVFTGKGGPVRTSLNSSLKTMLLDFTGFNKKGKYFLRVPSIGDSYHFDIADNVLTKNAVSGLKGFYFQRTNEELTPAYAGQWARSAGHPDTIVVVHPSAASVSRPAGTVISSPGGWYDAGDYNKYIVNSGISTGTLLSSFEQFTSFHKELNINIPESNDIVPDILNEALYNLRWMLTMQDPADGGVYHKLTNAAFDGMVMPGVTKEPRYVVQKGTAAALNLAAVAAQGARILRHYSNVYPGLADSCLAAANRAFEWAMANPNVIYDQRTINSALDPDITTGEYGDRYFDDEWIWASVEMFITTGDKKYFDITNAKLKDSVLLPSWSQVAALGYYSMLHHQKKLPKYTNAPASKMKDQLLKLAANYINKIDSNAFHCVMGQSRKDFVWGSSAVAANQGILLVNAYLLTGKTTFLNGALSNVDYLLGRNATGYCFLTGAGSKPAMDPHHRPSVADGIKEPVPGLLVGGPNPGMQDKCEYQFKEPETAFADHSCSYASNEIAINWNAPAVYLFAALEALQAKL
jgi:endoglucanase